MAREPKPQTRRIYDFICAYLRDQRRPPTLREIGEGVFMAHTSVLRHLAHLEGMGWIEREYNQPRSIRLGERAPDYEPPQGANQR